MTQAIMLQGTASDVGKSVLVAGLCRIFTDGPRPRRLSRKIWRSTRVLRRTAVEMGRAQIFQAEAAGILPRCADEPGAA